jgi:hypothetical protein
MAYHNPETGVLRMMTPGPSASTFGFKADPSWEIIWECTAPKVLIDKNSEKFWPGTILPIKTKVTLLKHCVRDEIRVERNAYVNMEGKVVIDNDETHDFIPVSFTGGRRGGSLVKMARQKLPNADGRSPVSPKKRAPILVEDYYEPPEYIKPVKIGLERDFTPIELDAYSKIARDGMKLTENLKCVACKRTA